MTKSNQASLYDLSFLFWGKQSEENITDKTISKTFSWLLDAVNSGKLEAWDNARSTNDIQGFVIDSKNAGKVFVNFLAMRKLIDDTLNALFKEQPVFAGNDWKEYKEKLSFPIPEIGDPQKDLILFLEILPDFIKHELLKQHTTHIRKEKSLSTEDFIRNLRVSYENDNEIKIQVPGRQANFFTCQGLGFRDFKTKAWGTFINILQTPPHTYNLGAAYDHYYVDSYTEKRSDKFEHGKFISAKYSVKGKRKPEYDKKRKRLDEISKKLKAFFHTKYSLEFPKNYNLYELCKAEKAGIYRFKFQVVFDDGTEGYYEREYGYYPKDRLIKEIESLANQYRKNKSAVAMERIAVATKIALSKEYLSKDDIEHIIKN